MSRFNNVILAAVVSLGGAGLVCADDAANSGAQTYQISAMSARAALATKVPELNVDGVALKKVLDYLRDMTNCNLVVNWAVLEGANVTKDAPITLSVHDLSMRKLLRLVLDQASPQTPLTWSVDSNVITVTTAAEADKVLITRVYVVDDLVMPDNRVVQPPTMNLQNVTQSGTTGGSAGTTGSGALGSGGGSGIFNPSTAETATKEETTQTKGEDLVKLIESVIRSDIWRDNGGNCSIKYFSGKLIITAPDSVHEMIGGTPLPEGGMRLGG